MDTKSQTSTPVTKGVESNAKEELKLSVDTVLYMLYIWYKANLISRDNLKTLLKVIKDPIPSDVPKYLAQEAAKG